jgi:hypothetical protein
MSKVKELKELLDKVKAKHEQQKHSIRSIAQFGDAFVISGNVDRRFGKFIKAIGFKLINIGGVGKVYATDSRDSADFLSYLAGVPIELQEGALIRGGDFELPVIDPAFDNQDMKNKYVAPLLQTNDSTKEK